MKRLISGVAIAIICFVSAGKLEGQRPGAEIIDHSEWVASVLKEIKSIQVGMTRKDLESVFTTEGGLSTRQSRTYVHRQCPYIKVDVMFESVQELAEKLKELPDDKIVSLSKPYLEYMILD
jgi:hypothetical protein